MNRLRPSRAVVVAGAGAALLLTAQPAGAAPTDTGFPIPIAVAGFTPPGFPAAAAGHVVASTDPEMPGVTRFTARALCCFFVHWCNLSTGAADTVFVNHTDAGYSSADARTGSRPVVATVTASTGSPGYPIVTVLRGTGGWMVS
ncbi:hypothetical protein [Prescottella equi]|uniref:hypothetical protein n=1 Tax=Rhodococcus hoagii TaxID=43767 RepID=UPI00119F6F8F|nr:hypothetical protein [Prescottella equi]